jgi:DNA invertase Pin-like site-specific DNA recombinase
MRRAFSYARFSHSAQADGFSLARQLEAAKAYCARNGLALDERAFFDRGVSAYRGSNSRGGSLAEFLDLIASGRVPKGTVLIIENLDRLSRLSPDEATALFMKIVGSGVDVVTLSPEQQYTRTNVHKIGVWVPLQVGIALAHEESRKKSERLQDAWARKRAALARGEKLTRRGPFWLRSDGKGGWVVLKDKAELVRQIFGWYVEGKRLPTVCGLLHELQPAGPTGRGWHPKSVFKLLHSRATIGEFQAHTGTTSRKGGVASTLRPVGEPVKGYFPPVVEEALFYRVQEMMNGRKGSGGRAAGVPSLFNGFLYDATDGSRMVINRDRHGRVLVSGAALRKVPGSRYMSLPAAPFETAVLDGLAELKPADVSGRPGPKEDAVEEWSGKLAAVNHRIGQVRQKAETADDPSIYFELIDSLMAERKRIISSLEAAKAEAANPAGETLGECNSLARLLADAEGAERDELRARVRAALRRLVVEAWLLVVPTKWGKVVALQVWFREGGHRDFLFAYAHRAFDRGRTRKFTAGGPLDLRKRKDAAALARTLGKLDPPAG